MRLVLVRLSYVVYYLQESSKKKKKKLRENGEKDKVPHE